MLYMLHLLRFQRIKLDKANAACFSGPILYAKKDKRVDNGEK